MAAGRDADVFDLGDGRVLRRSRDGRAVVAEAKVMVRLKEQGFPVPTVYEAKGADLVMERIGGPSLLTALQNGEVGVAEGAAVLVDLHRRLREIRHLDLHPDNVILGPDGPVLIDWTNSAAAPAELDTALSALILAQVAVGDTELAGLADRVLREFVKEADGVTELERAVAIRRRNPTMTERELADLGEAAELVRGVQRPGRW